MTSAPIIVAQLEGLSESFKDLSIEMTSFFAGLDADVDAILLVMEWAQRELVKLSQTPSSTIGSVWSNAHTLLSTLGLVSPDSRIMKELLGQTLQQQTRSTLERTFNEFLNVMEESINNELQYSIRLFGFFEAIDKQFLNLHRTVIREQDAQERIETDFLSSMWTKVVGVNASLLRKYEKNKSLLQSVRDRTVRNKHVLLDHNQRLRQMKSALEVLRQRLVSPMVRNSVNASTLSVEEQIRGLEATYGQLRATREGQKKSKMEVMWGVRGRRDELQVEAGLRGGGDGKSRKEGGWDGVIGREEKGGWVGCTVGVLGVLGREYQCGVWVRLCSLGYDGLVGRIYVEHIADKAMLYIFRTFSSSTTRMSLKPPRPIAIAECLNPPTPPRSTRPRSPGALWLRYGGLRPYPLDLRWPGPESRSQRSRSSGPR